MYPNGHPLLLQQNTKFSKLFPNDYLMFYKKHKILKTVPKRPFAFFTTKHKILKTVPKRAFDSLQRNTKLKTVPKFSSFFYDKIQNFEDFPKQLFAFLQWNTKFRKLYPNSHWLFYSETQNFESCNHGTMLQTGITCKKISCYMCDSASRWFIANYVKHFLSSRECEKM